MHSDTDFWGTLYMEPSPRNNRVHGNWRAEVAVWTDGCVRMMKLKAYSFSVDTSVHYKTMSKAKTWVGPRTADCNWWSGFDLPHAHIHLCHAQYITISHANDSAVRSRWLMAPWLLRYPARLRRTLHCVFLLTPAARNHVLQLRRLRHDVIRKPKWFPIWRVRYMEYRTTQGAVTTYYTIH